MADVLEFDSATEFQILETFDFEEVIQRPENLRFYTLDEQLLDFVEKSMPGGRLTRFQLLELFAERDRLEEAYRSAIDPNFELRAKRIARMPFWVHPLHSDLEYSQYKYGEQWTPIMEDRKTPNYYSRLLLSLPRPYITKEDGNPLITETSKMVGDNGEELVALGNYERTKTALHEDGSVEIVALPIPNTQDDVRIQGYSLDSRKIDIPNPLAEHPFLSSAQASKLITTEPFAEVYPSIDAILTHGVPTTQFPYTEGQKYLKVYDVELKDIAWELWRKRFPPVDSVETTPAPVSVKFPAPQPRTPSENLKKFYTTFYEGVDPYCWLMNQEDGGMFVAKMHLSKASESGLLAVNPVGEPLELQFPESSPEECLNTETFDAFVSSGIYRDKKCLPVSAIQNERAALISRGRQAWKESTEQDILKQYQLLLMRSSHLALPDKKVEYQKHATRDIPELRKKLLKILENKRLLASDKLNKIDELLEQIIPKDRVFLDEAGAFLLCNHSVAILKDAEAFSSPLGYAEWTVIESGYRVCKFCGEQINRDVFSDQDDFDENGNVIISREKLPTNVHVGDATSTDITQSLINLKPIFELEGKHVGRTLLYLLLSLFQVVPLEAQLVPVLSFIDGVTAVLKKAKKLTDETDGTLGIVGMSILLQTHNPFLIPRRSFGSKKLKLSGFPRDTEETKEAYVINTILYVLQSTFESFPTAITGPIAGFMRSLVSNPRKIRSEAIGLLGKAVSKFKAQFEDARERFKAVAEDVEVEQLKLPILVPKKDSVKPTEFVKEEALTSCSSIRPLTSLVARLPPSVSAAPLELQENIRVSNHATLVVGKAQGRMEVEVIPEKTIRDRIKKGIPKKLKIPALVEFVEKEQDGIAMLTLLSRLLDLFKVKDTESYRKTILTLQTRTNPSVLRDSVRGLLYSVLQALESKDDELKVAVKQDVVLRLLLTKKEEAEKEDQGLRARERELLKKRLREKSDAERENLKFLLDIGIAPYIITNEDRRQLAKESEDSVVVEADDERPDGEYDAVQGQDEDGDVEDNERGMRYNREEDYGTIGTQVAEETY